MALVNGTVTTAHSNKEEKECIIVYSSDEEEAKQNNNLVAFIVSAKVTLPALDCTDEFNAFVQEVQESICEAIKVAVSQDLDDDLSEFFEGTCDSDLLGWPFDLE